MVPPSRPDMEVVGVFNAAATRHDGDTVLLLRVSESPRKQDPNVVQAAVYNAARKQIEIKQWRKDTPGHDASDPRGIDLGGKTWLTSMSHLRVARSHDGVRFEVEPTPAVSPGDRYEAF